MRPARQNLALFGFISATLSVSSERVCVAGGLYRWRQVVPRGQAGRPVPTNDDGTTAFFVAVYL